MRLGLLADAHGNAPALANCLRHLSRLRVDRIVFLGDAVGYLDGEVEVLRLLEEAGAMCLCGNHEAMLLGALPLSEERDRVYCLVAARKRLQAHHVASLSRWQSSLEINLEGRQLLLVHGSPEDHLTGYVYPDDDVSRIWRAGYDAVFMGHTHRPFSRSYQHTLFANPGSCGLPRDQGNLSSMAIYDTISNEIEILRLPFEPQRVLASLGMDQTHPAVLKVLERRSPSPVVGRVVEE